METLLDHQVTLAELKQFDGFHYADSLDDYRDYLSVIVGSRKTQDCLYLRIAELYDLRRNPAKAAEYRAKIKDRSVLKPYVFEDWCGPGKQSDYEQAPDPLREAA